MKANVTKHDKIVVEGLRHRACLDEIEATMANILEVKSETTGGKRPYFGWISDAVSGGDDISAEALIERVAESEKRKS